LDVDDIGVSGVWWRHTVADADAHHRPDPPADNRWQRGDVVEGLYLADSPDTAWAEWYRYISETGVPPEAALPRDLWRWEIDIDHGLADLSTPDRLARVDLPEPIPGSSQWPAFQIVGERLWTAGFRGLLASATARPEGRTLCLFREDRVVEGATPLPPPEHRTSPPRVPRGMRT
jgi:hypothetical protein